MAESWQADRQGAPDWIEALNARIKTLEAENAALRADGDAKLGRLNGMLSDEVRQSASLRRVLGELIRLWRWRFELAKREKALSIEATGCVHGRCIHQQALQELAADLRKYGREKAAAWAEAIKVLEGGE